MPPSEDALDWMVRSRNNIQSLMLVLVQEPLMDESQNLYRLTGVAFSLWRAVFLVHRADLKRTEEEINKTGQEFLLRVVETNAIGFSDERNFSAWSCGYYVHSARLRLGLQGVSEGSPLREAWDEAFQALVSRLPRKQRDSLGRFIIPSPNRDA